MKTTMEDRDVTAFHAITRIGNCIRLAARLREEAEIAYGEFKAAGDLPFGADGDEEFGLFCQQAEQFIENLHMAELYSPDCGHQVARIERYLDLAQHSVPVKVGA